MTMTLRDLHNQRRTLHAYCDNEKCRRNMPVDLEKLIERLGPDHSAYRDHLVPKFRCSQCGSKNITLIYGADTSTETTRLAYEKAKGL